MSIHLWKSHALAREKGAWFGSLSNEQVKRLGEMSKRELIEIALHLASIAADNPDDPQDAYNRLMDEAFTLHANGLT